MMSDANYSGHEPAISPDRTPTEHFSILMLDLHFDNAMIVVTLMEVSTYE